MNDKPIDKRDAERALDAADLDEGEYSYSQATRHDMYEVKVLMMGLLQQGQKSQEQNGELITAFNRVADALERLEKRMDPQVRKGKPMKLDGMGK